MRKFSKSIISYIVATTMIVGMLPVVGLADQGEEILISDQIGIFGFQIKDAYDDNGEPDITFRTIGYGPKVGETITANGREYVIERTGIIYTLDSDDSGFYDRTQLDDSYTLLDMSTRTGAGMEEYYEGATKYYGRSLTYGFLTTDAGYAEAYSTVSQKNEDGTIVPLGTGYVRTMRSVGDLVANVMHIRAFVLTTDGNIIYSNKTEKASVASIAYTVYEKGKMPSKEGHQYVYDNIIHGEFLRQIYEKDNTYPYYWKSSLTVEWGWSDIVKPKS